MLFKTRREFIMNEKDVTTALSVINAHTSFNIKHVGNCGWANQPTTWFVVFDATNNEYKRIVKELINVYGKISVTARPGGKQDLYFERT
jgi:hypothetical protein